MKSRSKGLSIFLACAMVAVWLGGVVHVGAHCFAPDPHCPICKALNTQIDHIEAPAAPAVPTVAFIISALPVPAPRAHEHERIITIRGPPSPV